MRGRWGTQIIHSALEAFVEDVLPHQARPVYDRSDEADFPAYSLTPNGGVTEHSGPNIEPVLAPHTEEELENGAKLLMLRAAQRRRAEDIPHHFIDWDLPVRHHYEIQDDAVFGGDYEIERGDALLTITDPNLFGVVIRQEGLSTVLLWNPNGIVRCDPLAAEYIRPPLPPPMPLPRGSQAVRRARLQVERRARALLFRSLSREQKWELRGHRRVTVTGQDGMTYRIYAWMGMNVRVVEDNEETGCLCVVPRPENPVPLYDLMLAQKVLLERNIAEFMKIAVRRTY